MILHGIEYQRPTSLNMRIMADHVTYSFLAFMKSIFHFCLGCYCGGYSQNGRSNLSSWSCLLCGSLPIGQILFKFDINTSHGEMICYKQFSGQNVKVTWVMQSFCHVGFFLTSLWLFDYFMDLLHLWHKHKSWGDYVMQTISQSKGQWSRSLRLFKFLALSASWPISWIWFICGTNTT